ncbi:hypothetical protein Poly51_30960 [Rubripirellula tenax]|uniref:ATP-dependent zinc metalloprotease FtsH n=2 Tax=Rubripirellula tenax TaxID=2528015 RepID=A0A5C6F3L6_9BACT|nr:hypothetical protein Poly51_30960 [Rubripirellula tenax]
MSSVEIEDVDLGVRRDTAYHEAAHAIIFCLFGDGECIDFATITGRTEEELGLTKLKPGFSLMLCDIETFIYEGLPDDVIERTVVRYIVNCYAGFAAEHRLLILSQDLDFEVDDDSPNQLSARRGIGPLAEFFGDLDLDDQIERGLFEEDYDGIGVYEDYESAVGAARLFLGADRDDVQLLLDHCATIAEELLRDPVVWRCVDELATELLELDSVSGDVIHARYSRQAANCLVYQDLIQTAASDYAIEGVHRFGFTIRNLPPMADLRRNHQSSTGT